MKKFIYLLWLLFFGLNAKSEVLFFQAFDIDTKTEILLDSVQLIGLDGRNNTIYFDDMLHYYNWQKPNDANETPPESEFFKISNNFPNPFSDLTSFIISSSGQGQLNINIYNAIGQLVFYSHEYFLNNQQEIKIELNDMLNGIYIVIFELNGKIKSKKIFKSYDNFYNGTFMKNNLIDLNNSIQIFTPEQSQYTFIGYSSGYENDTLYFDKISNASSYRFNMKKLDGTLSVSEFRIMVHLPNSIIYDHYFVEQWDEDIEKFDTTKFEYLKIGHNAKINDNKFSWITTYDAFPEEIGKRYVLFNIDTNNKKIKDFILSFNIDSVDGGDIYHIQYTLKLNNIAFEQINENDIIAKIVGSDLRENLFLGYHSFFDFVYGNHRTEQTLEFQGVLDYYEDSYVEIIIKLE